MENIETDRLTLMTTLLRAIEQSDSHSPSSVEAYQNKETAAHLQPPANGKTLAGYEMSGFPAALFSYGVHLSNTPAALITLSFYNIVTP